MSSEDKDLIDLDTTPDPSQRKRAWSGLFKGIFDDEEDKPAASTSPTSTPAAEADAANPPASGFDRNWRFPSPARADNNTSPPLLLPTQRPEPPWTTSPVARPLRLPPTGRVEERAAVETEKAVMTRRRPPLGAARGSQAGVGRWVQRGGCGRGDEGEKGVY